MVLSKTIYNFIYKICVSEIKKTNNVIYYISMKLMRREILKINFFLLIMTNSKIIKEFFTFII
jgi:hypothetical protein